jgi:2-phospho-L-lactate/phosphoenolpyruvate guanylyltransferase
MLEQSVPHQIKWHALIPAKALHNSKSRLDRSDLAAAFLADTVAALLGSANVAQLTVITADAQVATLVENLGGDAILEGAATGLLPALELGIASVPISNGIVIALGDLPCLETADVDFFLTQAAHHDSSFTCDSGGTGSTMWARLPGSSAKPRFGVRSRADHRMHGAVEIGGSPGAHRDVDTSTDLWDAIRIGVGQHTLKALSAPPMFSATISGIDPLTAVDESGLQRSYSDYTMPELIAPRIGQRIHIDSENRRILL